MATTIRVELAVRDAHPGMSRREAILLCERGAVRDAKGTRIKKGTQVDATQPLQVDLAALDERSEAERAALANKGVHMLLAGPRWSVVYKPAGLGSLSRHYGDTLHFAAFAEKLIGKDLSALPDRGVVHRLDNGTSGAMLVAHDVDMLNTFIAARGHTLQRTYWAMAKNLRDDTGTVSTPIEGQTAVTTYKVLQRVGDTALFQAQIQGGRRHQIRIHMASLGAPLLGDGQYGETPRERLALHAYRLDFVTDAPQSVTNAPGDDFWALSPHAFKAPQ